MTADFKFILNYSKDREIDCLVDFEYSYNNRDRYCPPEEDFEIIKEEYYYKKYDVTKYIKKYILEHEDEYNKFKENCIENYHYYWSCRFHEIEEQEERDDEEYHRLYDKY